MEATDDFTIVLDEPGNMDSCGIEVFEGLGQLWKLVQRYGMKTPLMIKVIDSQAACIRTFRAVGDQACKWHLTDETPSTSADSEAKSITFPLTIESKDATGNMLKMRVQLVTKPAPTPQATEQPSNQLLLPN